MGVYGVVVVVPVVVAVVVYVVVGDVAAVVVYVVVVGVVSVWFGVALLLLAARVCGNGWCVGCVCGVC